MKKHREEFRSGRTASGAEYRFSRPLSAQRAATEILEAEARGLPSGSIIGVTP
jgi:hypothetical protein